MKNLMSVACAVVFGFLLSMVLAGTSQVRAVGAPKTTGGGGGTCGGGQPPRCYRFECPDPQTCPSKDQCLGRYNCYKSEDANGIPKCWTGSSCSSEVRGPVMY